MKIYSYLLLFLLISLSFGVWAEPKWEFINDDEYCYIQSIPIETDIPEGKVRGDHGILVYRMHKNPEMTIQLTAGFSYKSSDSIVVNIDDNNYDFYTDDDTGWAKDDKKVIAAMKKGLKLITTGISSKGTKVVDIYSLKGFTAAINKLKKDC